MAGSNHHTIHLSSSLSTNDDVCSYNSLAFIDRLRYKLHGVVTISELLSVMVSSCGPHKPTIDSNGSTYVPSETSPSSVVTTNQCFCVKSAPLIRAPTNETQKFPSFHLQDEQKNTSEATGKLEIILNNHSAKIFSHSATMHWEEAKCRFAQIC